MTDRSHGSAPTQLFLVEDRRADVRLTLEAFRYASSADIVKSYKLHANCCLTKPVGFTVFEGLMNSINEFWLEKARLPHLSTANE